MFYDSTPPAKRNCLINSDCADGAGRHFVAVFRSERLGLVSAGFLVLAGLRSNTSNTRLKLRQVYAYCTSSRQFQTLSYAA